MQKFIHTLEKMYIIFHKEIITRLRKKKVPLDTHKNKAAA